MEIINNKIQHFIIVYNKDADIIEKNVYKCESEVIYNSLNYYIVKKTFNNIIIFITNSKYQVNTKSKLSEFVRGFVYKDNKEYKIFDYITLFDMQIGNYAYDNITLCRI